MNRKTIAAVALLFPTLAATPALAVTNNFHYHKWASSGRKELLGISNELDDTCRVKQITPLTVLAPPQHGTLLFARGLEYPKFNIGNPHYKCSFKRVLGLKVIYRSALGFIGTDRFEFKETALDGDVNLSVFDMTVR